MRIINSHQYVYIVRCDGGKLGDCFYIGTWGGDNPEVRFQHHKNGCGSKFCKKYKPIDFKIHSRVLNSMAYRVESEVTCQYMKKYGFRRVRGSNMLNMQPNCHYLSSLRWWLDPSLQKDLDAGLLGLPDSIAV